MRSIRLVAFGLALVTFAGVSRAGAMTPTDSAGHVPPKLARDIRNDKRDVKQDDKQIKADRRDVRADEHQVRTDIQDGRTAEARRDLHAAVAAHKAVQAERVDATHDTRALHRAVARARRIGG